MGTWSSIWIKLKIASLLSVSATSHSFLFLEEFRRIQSEAAGVRWSAAELLFEPVLNASVSALCYGMDDPRKQVILPLLLKSNEDSLTLKSWSWCRIIRPVDWTSNDSESSWRNTRRTSCSWWKPTATFDQWRTVFGGSNTDRRAPPPKGHFRKQHPSISTCCGRKEMCSNQRDFLLRRPNTSMLAKK